MLRRAARSGVELGVELVVEFVVVWRIGVGDLGGVETVGVVGRVRKKRIGRDAQRRRKICFGRMGVWGTFIFGGEWKREWERWGRSYERFITVWHYRFVCGSRHIYQRLSVSVGGDGRFTIASSDLDARTVMLGALADLFGSPRIHVTQLRFLHRIIAQSEYDMHVTDLH